MRFAPVLILAALAFAPAAAADNHKPRTRIICIDVGGQSLPAVCRRVGGRLERASEVCSCPEGRPVEAPLCGPGERAPEETLAFERARRDAARDGTLVGDRQNGRSFCIPSTP
jgi:hypothetical protein